MAIYIKQPVRVGGSVKAVGDLVVAAAADEADLVARGLATWAEVSDVEIGRASGRFAVSPMIVPSGKQGRLGDVVSTSDSWTVTQTASAPSAVRSNAYPIPIQRNVTPLLVGGTSSGAGQYVRATQVLPRAIVNRKLAISVPVFVPDYTKVASIIISVSDDAFASTSWSVTYTPEFSGLHVVGLSARIVQGLAGGLQWTTANGATVEDVLTSLRYQVTLASSVTGSVAFGDPVVGAVGRANVMIAVDDGEASFMRQVDSTVPYSAFDYLIARDIPSTSFLVSALVGTAGYVTANDVRTMLAAGHCVCPHGAASLASLADDAARRADVASNIAGLAAMGVPMRMLRSMYAYPSGIFEVSAGDTSIMQILRDNGIRAARTAARRSSMPMQVGAHRQYHLNILGHYTDVGGGGETTTETQALIRDLVETGGSGIVLFHKFVSGAAADTLEVQLSEFVKIVDTIAAYRNDGVLDVVTAESLADAYFPTAPVSNTP